MSELKINKRNLIVSILFVLLATFLFLKIRDTYYRIVSWNWSDYSHENFQIKSPYSLGWNYRNINITNELSPLIISLKEVSEHDSEVNDSYIRREGIFSGLNYWLEYTVDGNEYEIRSVEELINSFAPIDNEKEALSFVGLTISDIKRSKERITGWTSTVEGYYLVQVTANNTYGCGNHRPSKEMYVVKKSGEIFLVGTQDLPDLPFDSGMCID